MQEFENLPYLNLISSVLEQAENDIDENNEYSKDAIVFLGCSWGNYLKDVLNSIEYNYSKKKN